MNTPRISRSICLYSIIGLFAALGLVTHVARRMTCTGDEPRYLLYALSLNLEGIPVMSDQGYDEFRKIASLRLKVAPYPIADIQHASKTPFHPIATSLILAPWITTFPLQQVRLVSFAAGLIGLTFLARLLLAQSISLLSALACFIPAAFFFPAISYYFLALPEIFLFLLVSIAFWNVLAGPKEGLRGYWPSIVCSCLAPVVHLRGIALPVAIGAFLAVEFGWKRRGKAGGRALIILASSYLVAAGLTVLYNQLVHGNVVGSVTTARPAISLETISALLVDWRHGLLTYSPIYLLSAAGLVAGLCQRRPWALPAGIFLLVMVLTSAGPGPGESYSARFWVQSVPVLSITLLGFTEGRMHAIGKVLIYLLLGALCLANTILFFVTPDLYLSGRSASLAYHRLFEIIPWLHLGFWVDLLSDSHYRFWAVFYLAMATVTLISASIYRSRLVTALAVVVILAGIEIHRARPVKQSAALESNALAIVIEDDATAQRGLFRLDLRPPWKGVRAEHPVTISDGTGERLEVVKGTVIFANKERAAVRPFILRIVWDPSAVDVAYPEHVRVAASDSWLARLWQNVVWYTRS